MGPTPKRDAPGHPTPLAKPGLAHLPSGLQHGELLSQNSCSSLYLRTHVTDGGTETWVTTAGHGLGGGDSKRVES